MARRPLPPLACVLSFIDAINTGDLDRLTSLMSVDHRLVVLDEESLVGRAANTEAWRSYFSSFPSYVIYPRFLVAHDECVAVLGTTTGSHLGLADDEERRLGVIWVGEVDAGVLSSWQILDDTADDRERLGIPGTA
jgi:SnoaL-like domain